jgi:hypothetical protein
MANIEHKTLGYTEQHVIHFKEYANAAARIGASGLAAADDNKIALQTDDNTLWILTDYSGPTWVALSLQADGAITAAKLASDAVETAKIKDANVTYGKMASGVVIPSGTIMLFGQNSAPTGWTKKTDWQDNAMLCYATGNIGNGGSVNPQSAHTHTGPSHTHTGPSHTHTGPSHTHAVALPKQGWAGEYGETSRIYAGVNSNSVKERTLTSGASGTGATGASGTGVTGAGGTGATGANTAPHYQEVIAATKD